MQILPPTSWSFEMELYKVTIDIQSGKNGGDYFSAQQKLAEKVRKLRRHNSVEKVR